MKKLLLASVVGTLCSSAAFSQETEASFKAEHVGSATKKPPVQIFVQGSNKAIASFKTTPTPPDSYPFDQFINLKIPVTGIESPIVTIRCLHVKPTRDSDRRFAVKENGHYTIKVEFIPNAFPEAKDPILKPGCKITWQEG